MPGRDKTGPMGAGPLTGGGRGSCGAKAAGGGGQPGGRGPRGGRGWQGAGKGRGHRHQFHATGLTGWQRAALDSSTGDPGQARGAGTVPESEMADLRAWAASHQATLEEIAQRIAALEAVSRSDTTTTTEDTEGSTS